MEETEREGRDKRGSFLAGEAAIVQFLLELSAQQEFTAWKTRSILFEIAPLAIYSLRFPREPSRLKCAREL